MSTLSLTSSFQSLQRTRLDGISPFRKLESRLRAGNEEESDPTKISDGSKKLDLAAKQGAKSGGALASLVNAIDDVATHLSDIDSKIAAGNASESTLDALKKEREALEKQLTQIISPTDPNSSFSKLFQISKNTVEALQGGQSVGGDPYAGGAYGRLVGSGNLVAVQGIDGALVQIGDTASDGQISSDEIAQLRQATDKIRFSLSNAPEAASAVTQESTKTKNIKTAEPFELQQISFEGASNLAIGLRTATSENLIKAAGLGLDLNLEQSIILTLKHDDKDLTSSDKGTEIISKEKNLGSDSQAPESSAPTL